MPSLFFSSNLHNDYHTPRDEPKTIDYAKLTRITKWMYMTGWLAANAKERILRDMGTSSIGWKFPSLAPGRGHL